LVIDQVGLAIGGSDAIDTANVRMIQPRALASR
jgi:hypothetical protein